jgi:hypothetical protein
MLAVAMLTGGLCWTHEARAIDIQGVENAAADLPRIYARLRPAGGGPLYESFLGADILAFFDTGASGILVSDETATELGLPRVTDVEFQDVGVGGVDSFDVSQPFMVELANFAGFDEPVYTHVYDNQRTQIGPVPAPVGNLFGGLDVFGMPLMLGKTVVFDSRPPNDPVNIGFIETTIYESSPSNPSVPLTHRTIVLSYGDFSRFTQVVATGPGAPPPPLPEPTLAHNPFVGPNPLLAIEPGDADDTPAVKVSYNGQSSEGSWLFDSGATVSMIKLTKAAELGVAYSTDPAHDGESDDPQLVGVPLEDQFQLTLTGVGGETKRAGFYLDALVLPTEEGSADADDPMNIRFLRAPVLVADISVKDPVTQDVLVLDGVLGMNFLTASWLADETPGAPISLDPIAGAFDFLVFDEPSGTLKLRFDPDLIAKGDLDATGSIDDLDIALFVAALQNADEAGFHVDVPWGVFQAGDFTGDNLVNAADIDGFVATMADATGLSPSEVRAMIPEPATMGIVLLLGPVVLRRGRGR